jgi:membrane protein DedA with SNARE-associated domain
LRVPTPAPGRGGRIRILTLVLQAVAPIAHLHHMTLLERLWKYTAFGASTIVFEEANPIIGGIAVRHGRAGMFGVVATVAIGVWAASIALYLLGRWRIEWVRRKWPNKEPLLNGALRIVHGHPWRASLAIRFAYWLRVPLPIACGAARVPFSIYLAASGISCWVWSFLFVWLGFALGRKAFQLLDFTRRTDVRLALIALLLAVALTMLMRRRRLAERTARLISGEHIPIMTTAERTAPGWLPPRGERR